MKAKNCCATIKTKCLQAVVAACLNLSEKYAQLSGTSESRD